MTRRHTETIQLKGPFKGSLYAHVEYSSEGKPVDFSLSVNRIADSELGKWFQDELGPFLNGIIRKRGPSYEQVKR